MAWAIADTTAFALDNLQKRGEMFVGPGVEVYEGMIVGESTRDSDLDVNVTREKKLTNVRASSSAAKRASGTRRSNTFSAPDGLAWVNR